MKKNILKYTFSLAILFISITTSLGLLYFHNQNIESEGKVKELHSVNFGNLQESLQNSSNIFKNTLNKKVDDRGWQKIVFKKSKVKGQNIEQKVIKTEQPLQSAEKAENSFRQKEKDIIEEKENYINVVLQIKADDKQDEYAISLEDGNTVYDLLKKASLENNFSLRVKEYSFGVFIEEIAGVRNESGLSKYWTYYINDKFANKGADSQKLKDGDAVKWVYGKTN